MVRDRDSHNTATLKGPQGIGRLYRFKATREGLRIYQLSHITKRTIAVYKLKNLAIFRGDNNDRNEVYRSGPRTSF